MSFRRESAPWPAAPGNGATIVLFCTHPRVPGGGAGSPVGPTLGRATPFLDSVTCLWHKNDQASAANGVRIYMTDDAGVTWHESDRKDDSDAATIGAAAPRQVPVLTPPQEWRETFLVSDVRGFAIEYTAGATGPTPVTGWRGTITINQFAEVTTR